MITFPEFQKLFNRLCKRYRQRITKETTDQAEAYFDSFSDFNHNRLQEAIEAVMNESRHFPTPNEIKIAYYSIHSMELQGGPGQECSYCDAGHVFFKIGKRNLAAPCAHCRGNSISPHVAKVGGKIFWAYKKTKQTHGGEIIYKPDLINMEPIKNAVPK